MRITIISHGMIGYYREMILCLEKKGHIVNHIDFNPYDYKYPNFLFRIYHIYLKFFLKKKLRQIHIGNEINKKLKAIGEIQDVVLTLRGDCIDLDCLTEFKKYTKKSIAFLNDNTRRFPKIIGTIPSFDEVYSFEKEDCIKYNLKFIPNWIHIYNTDVANSTNFKYDVFNITSIDNRFDRISKIANALDSKKIASKIIVADKKMRPRPNSSIEIIPRPIPIGEVEKYIEQSKIMLDVHHENQIGLTFRVFESIGLNKKLITTNPDVKNYDFYNPNNILIIDPENVQIPDDFLKTPYKKIPEDIYNKYTLSTWVDTVFCLNTHKN